MESNENFAVSKYFVKSTDCSVNDTIQPSVLLGDIQENAEDIYAEAQQINEERAAKEAAETRLLHPPGVESLWPWESNYLATRARRNISSPSWRREILVS